MTDTSRDTAETAELLHAELHHRTVLSVTIDDLGWITISHCPPGYPRAHRELVVFPTGYERILAHVLPVYGSAA